MVARYDSAGTGMAESRPCGNRFARGTLALVVSVLLGVFGRAALAQPDAAAGDQAASIIQPDAVYTYPGDTWIRSIHLAPDG